MLARQLIQAIDPKGGGKLTQEKTLAAFDKFFKEWDKDKNGTLDEAELAEGLNRLFAPPGIGPPGGAPGGAPIGPPAFEEKKKEEPGR